MYAIVRTGGKQYRVEEGRSLDVELLPAKEGASVELDNVLLIADEGDVTVGTPVIEGARVIADVESHGREKKIVVFKYKSKVRTRKKTGHRQHFTRLAVTEILRPGQESKVSAAKKAAPKRRTRKSAAKAPADVAVADADATAAAPAEKASADAAVAEASASAAAPAEKVSTDAGVAEASASAAAPKRRTRKPAAPKAAAESGEAEASAPAAAPKRRRRKPSAKKAADDKAGAEKKPARKPATKKADEDKE